MAVQLRGARIWLSAAVPPEATEEQKSSMLLFIKEFAARVFESGGYIIHGSHPSITPLLVEQAQRHVEGGGRRDCLTLAVSRFWSKEPNTVPVQEWRKHCVVYETPEAKGVSARDESLRLLRQWMATRCDAFIALGGLWWKQIVGRAGVPLEASLAIDRGLPCFLLGGLGGAASTYITEHSEVLKSLRNGFDPDTNARLALSDDVSGLTSIIIDQLDRLPLVRGHVTEGMNFRILALDGGGIKGAFTASALATFEESLGLPVLDHFDMIAGTSTGGILALGLSLGISARDMLSFYRERGPTIFPMMRLHNRIHRGSMHALKVKFSQKTLLSELCDAYYADGVKTMQDASCRLVIPAYDAISGVCHVFRTPHHPLLTSDSHSQMANVALATAAAPTYFNSAKVRNSIANVSYFDGGVWANCPAMAAIVEAVCYLDIPIDRIDILSVGTTGEPFTVKNMGSKGLIGWRKIIVDVLMNAQMDSSIQHAEKLVGSPRFLRINSTMPPGMYQLDSSRDIEDLISLGNRAASNPDLLLQVRSRFLNGVGVMGWREHAKQAYEY